MSDKPCGRGNCPNVLCDRYIHYRGSYICFECWGELDDLKKTWIPPITEDQMKAFIDQFMETDSGVSGYIERDRIFDSLIE